MLRSKDSLPYKALLHQVLIIVTGIGLMATLFICFGATGHLGFTILVLLPTSLVSAKFIVSAIYSFRLQRTQTRIGSSECSENTIVFVPTMLTSIEHFSEVCRTLIANYKSCSQTDKLSFVVFLDYIDSPNNVGPSSEEKSLFESCRNYIEALNRHRNIREKKFYCAIRDRAYSMTQRQYIGKERKRGKFEELLRVCRGIPSKYIIPAEDLEMYRSTRYIITIDDDSIFSFGSIEKLIGAMSDTLIVTERDSKGIHVTSGHGMIVPKLTPRFVVDGKSVFVNFKYSIDYNKLLYHYFGECIFPGKAILDIDSYIATTLDKMPDEKILSHDIVEGSHLRPGYCEAALLTESIPSSIVSEQVRKNRWIRGDIQNFWYVFVCRRNGWLRSVGYVPRLQILDSIGNYLATVFGYFCTVLGIAFFNVSSELILIFVFLSWLPGPLFTIMYFVTDAFSRQTKASFIDARKITLDILREFFTPLFMLPIDALIAARGLCEGLIAVLTKRNLLKWSASSTIVAEKEFCNHWSIALAIIPLALQAAAVTLAWQRSAVAAALLLVWSVIPLFAFVKVVHELCSVFSRRLGSRFTSDSTTN
jgi:cyclic beta-1,2-glucan synthetase